MFRLVAPMVLALGAVGGMAAPSLNTNHPFNYGYYVPTSTGTNFDLTYHFVVSNPSPSNTLISNTVLMSSTLGDFFIRLFPSNAPITAQNFLRYVNAGSFDHLMISRSVPGFVIQGGQFTYDNTSGISAVSTFPAIISEVGSNSLPNSRGTLAMALGSDTNGNYLTNSATSQWFVNLSNNTALDPHFTVFGQVIGNGMNVIDAIAALPVNDFNGPPLNFSGSALTDVPLKNWTNTNSVSPENLVLINRAITNPTTPFHAVSSDPDSFKAELSGSRLTVRFLKYPTNLATTQDFVRITSFASDTNGNIASSSFVVVPFPTGSQSITFPSVPQQVLTTNQFTLQSLLTNAPTASSGLPVSVTWSGPLAQATNGQFYFKGTGTITLTAKTSTNWPYYYYYKPAPPVTVRFLVKSNSQTLGDFGNIPTAPFGQNIQIFPPSASSGLPVSVTVKSGPAKLAGWANGNVLLTPTGVGSVTIAANQPGNAQYIPAPQVVKSFVIVKGTPTVNFTPLTNLPNAPGKTFRLTASSTARLPVSFTSSDTNVVSIVGTTATLRSLGSTTITATSPANSNWNSAQSVQALNFR
jgi:peptidyl-prolyl cis-trans isomerase A (cyclophilin A)